MEQRLKGKVALVTGCGSSTPGLGNGRAIAILFARAGARVFGCDIALAAAEETRQLVLGQRGDMAVCACDVTDAAQVQSLVDTCIARYGRIDVLVNNVGIVRLGGPVELSLEDWQQSLEINLTSMFLTCKYTIPHMLNSGAGSIILLGSVAGSRDSGVVSVKELRLETKLPLTIEGHRIKSSWDQARCGLTICVGVIKPNLSSDLIQRGALF